MKNSYAFFNNTDCAYFPCHMTDWPDDFNCKYCYCPLYLLECKGHYMLVNGVKDCSNCLLPHRPDSDLYINKLLREQVFSKVKPHQ
ncbi:MAG: metal-binding protein [Firmicutes bacterium HGW-Firmicutes-3]|jgi:hypothetical protein|nr:MAG: metal-binding protein [Firmicutes bacterium HGW-Firmicutes-3]